MDPPPPKRLRILQSVEVDETDPEYVHAKQKQNQKLKGRFESIFAKYEHMHESMSDEIDMKTSTVVVDNGHLRRLNRQVARKETVLLDTLLEHGGSDREDESDKEEEDDTEDELAPSREPKRDTARTGDAGGEQQQQPCAREGAQPIPTTDNRLDVQSPNNTSSAIAQANTPRIPNTPNHAANLLQFVQFPQTPEGQQAQHAFYSTLTMTINQAVQQAVAPLFSNILGHTPNASSPFAHILPAPGTPTTASDTITPARDPKWLFPPLPDRLLKPQVAQSSPIPPLTSNPQPQKSLPRAIEEKENIGPQQQSSTVPETPVPVVKARRRKVLKPVTHDTAPEGVQTQPLRPRRSSPRVEIQTRPLSKPKKHHFTQEDDIYISKRKAVHKCTWAQIRASREEWKNWPLNVFWQRWSHHLKGKKLHETSTSASTSSTQHAIPDTPQDEAPRSPTRSYHLPTPSSLEQEDRAKEVLETDSEPELEPESADGAMEIPASSNTHYDDDDLDLLSLADADANEFDLPLAPANENDEASSLPPEDIALPSIEAAEFLSDDMIQQQLLDQHDSTLEDAGVENLHEITIATTAISSPTKNPAHPPPAPYYPPAKRHVPNPNPNPHPTVLRARDASDDDLDLVAHHDDDDEVPAPTAPHTPYIKHESPPPALQSLLFSTPMGKTPAGARSTDRISRKKFLKQVKQSWSKGTPGGRARTSLGGAARERGGRGVKRKWGGDAESAGESEDELAR